MNEGQPRASGTRGFFVVAAMALLGAIFVWLLYGLTSGRRSAPPPEFRPPATERR